MNSGELFKTVNSFLSRCCLLLLRGYQWTVSLVLPPACRFQPSCSAYFMDAVALHGLSKGIYLGLKRLLRCQPWGEPGYDPVPMPKTGSIKPKRHC